MGHTLDEAKVNAEDALQDWMDSMEELGHEIPDPSPLEAIDVPADSTLSTILLVRPSRSRSVRLNLVVDSCVATVINSEARRRGMTRKSYVEWMVRRTAQMGGLVDCIRRVNGVVEGTKLPRVREDRPKEIIHRDSLGILGLG